MARGLSRLAAGVFGFRGLYKRSRAFLVILVVLTGCATTQPDIVLGHEEYLAITVVESSTWPGAIELYNESVGGDSREALVGAGAGALAGGAWGLACGPLAPLCVPLGVLAGADIGVLAGLAVGTTAALPADKADRLRDRLTRSLQSHELRRELEAEVIELAKARWNVSAEQPTVAVGVELRDLVLESTRDERIRCAIRVAVTVRRAGTKQPNKDKPRVYAYVSPYGSLAAWLDEGDGQGDAYLASATRNLAAQIVSGLSGGP